MTRIGALGAAQPPPGALQLSFAHNFRHAHCPSDKPPPPISSAARKTLLISAAWNPEKMRKLISKLFGFRPPSPPARSSQPDFAVSRMTEESPMTIEDGSDNALRRQLVHVLLRDVLRRHGIPASLVECQMLVVSSRSRGPGMYVRLVLKQWDERLVRYAFAFQKALKADILRFEPQANEWLHGISWQFEFGESCPFAALPDKSFWQTPAPQAATTDAASVAAATSNSAGNSDRTSPTHTPGELAAAARLANAARRATLANFDAPSNDDAATDLMPLRETTADTKKSEEEEDLDRLFAIRDRELARQTDAGVARVEFAKTQPWKL